MKYLRVSLCLGATMLLAGSAFGQEKQISETDLPSAVQKTVGEQSKGAAVKGFSKEMENGKPSYEVQLMVNGHSKDVSMDADGNVTEVEEQVALDQLPSAVKAGLQAKAGHGKITKIESLTKQGSVVAYEAQVMKSGKHSEIQVGPDGKPLNHEE